MTPAILNIIEGTTFETERVPSECFSKVCLESPISCRDCLTSRGFVIVDDYHGMTHQEMIEECLNRR